MAGLEDMLLGGSDDDSSGDEAEAVEQSGGVAAPAPAPAAPAPAPAPSPRSGKGGKNLAAAKARADANAKAAAEKQQAAAAAPAPGAGAGDADGGAAAPAPSPGQSEVTRRLKSLYSPAAEAHQQEAQQQQAQQPPAAARRAAPHPGAPVPAAPPAPGPSASSLVANMDLEPTSLSTIRQKQQARARQQQQQQMHHHNHPAPSQHHGGGSRRSSGGGGSISSHGSGSEGGGGGRSSSSAYPPQYSQQQPGGGSSRYHGGSGSSMSSSSGAAPPRGDYNEKKKKEQFLMFTRVLMKYLESKDAAMHQRAKQAIKDCAEKNKMGDPNYASLTLSMREQLRQVVGEQYWRKAEDYLKHFLQTKGAEQTKRALSSQPQQRPVMGSGGPMRSPPGDYVPQQQQQAQQRPMPAQSKNKGGSAVGLTSQQKRAEEKKREQEKLLRQQAKTQKGKAQQKGSGSADTKKAASQQAQTEIQKAAQLLNMRQRGVTPPANFGGAAAALLAGGKAGGGSSVASASSYGDKQTLELMEHLDHAVIYDQASCSILLSKDYREDIDIQREQKKLLFGDGNSLGKVIRVPPSAGNSAAVIAGPQVGDIEKPSLYKGWSNRNIVSARTAWAKVRLPENEAASSPDRPLLPGEKDPAPIAVESADAVETSTAVGNPYEWFNETRAEEDETLTLLSEATEMYVRSLLEGSINQARQRQNLDGVRLWYQQHNGATKAPLCLRLGCDVKRQEALATGNAAMTVKRMEEALDRQKLPQNERNLNSNETLYKATSMSDLAKRPRLARAPERAEFDAKRSFEEYSGKNSGAPPLGRVPKKVKIGKKDITSCVQDPHFPWKRKRTVAANI